MNRWFPKQTALAALVAVLGAGPAGADTLTRPYAGVSVEQLFDSNVMNHRGADEVTRVGPRVGLMLESPRLRLDAEYRLALHAYAQGTADSSINHRGALGAKYELTPRLELGADGVLLAGDDPVLLDRPGVAIPQGAFFDLSAHLGAAWRSSRRGTLSADYSVRRSRFDLAGGMDPLAYDGDEHRLDAAFAYRVTRRLTARLLGRGQHFVSYGATESLGDAVGGGAGVEYALTRLWRARAQGGPLWFTATPVTGGGGTGWFASADLTRTGERWRVALRGVHDVYGGTSAAEAVWAESLQLDGVLRLYKNLALRARAGGYRGGVAPDGDTNVSGLLGHVELGWMVWRGARLDLYAEHRAQDAAGGLSFGNLQRTIAGIRLTAVAGIDLMSLGETP